MTLRNKQSGFTIVELLIVIVVIGILAGLVIVTFNGIQQKGRNTERTTDLKALESHVQAYNAQNGKYPTYANLNDTAWVAANLKGLDKEALRDPKNAGYTIATTPTSNEYSYEVDDGAGGPCDNSGTDCAKFTLTAKYEGGAADLVLTGSN